MYTKLLAALLTAAILITGAAVAEGNITDGTTPVTDFVVATDGKTAVIRAYTGDATSVTIPETIDGATVTAISETAFKGNTTIESVVLPETLTDIGEEAFFQCANLKSVNVDSVQSFGERCFAMTALEGDVDISAGNVEVGASAFWYTNITGIFLCASTVDIRERAFGDCDKLEYVYIAPYATVTFSETTSDDWAVFEDSSALNTALIPGTQTALPDKLFYKNPLLVIYALEGSYAQQFALDHMIPCNTKDFASMNMEMERRRY